MNSHLRVSRPEAESGVAMLLAALNNVAAQHIFQFFESLDGESLRDKFVEAPRKFIITELSSSDLWKHRVDLLLQNFSILFLTTLLVDDFFLVL